MHVLKFAKFEGYFKTIKCSASLNIFKRVFKTKMAQFILQK